MPFKNKEDNKNYHKKYDRKRTELLHQAKISLGIPVDTRRKNSKISN
jgi:hypothetical protein